MGSRSILRRSPLRLASAIALLVALLVSVAAALATHRAVGDQESRLLKERAVEVGLVLTSSIAAIPATLGAQGGILTATHGSKQAYTEAAAGAVAAGPGKLTFAWLRPQPGGSGYEVLAAAGDALHAGDIITDQRAATFRAAAASAEMVATPVIGAERSLGFALGPPAAPAGTVLYRQSQLGPLAPPRQASTAPFAELDVVIYGSPTADPAEVLASTTHDLQLHGTVRREPLMAGSSRWLLLVKARRPLVGTVTAQAEWLVLLVGLVGSLLIAAVIEATARRRDAALALYASEHHVAETLQRSLLPQIPTLAGLELAARYLAGSRGQEVGGDWFDAFRVSGDRVGIAIGDVIGHDLAAASAMAQIRAALRAYALDGDDPASVINRLDRFVDTFGLTQLVTVFYGVLDPAAPDGGRVLRYTNAGHLPPLLRAADGSVDTLSGGSSVVIGAPITVDHAQATQRLEPGSTLLLFTDGLVELPNRSLEDTLQQLATTVAEHDVGLGVDALCEHVLGTMSDRSRRDDIALLAVRLVGVSPAPISEPAASAQQQLT